MTASSNARAAYLPCSLVFVFALTLLPEVLHAVEAYTDRSEITLGDTLTVTFSVEGGAGTPDFSAIGEDFEILGRSQQARISVINGRSSRTTVYLLNLRPRRDGELTIPAVSFGGERSDPLAVKVAPLTAGASDEAPLVKFEVEPSTEEPFVQAQTIITVRLLRRVEVANAEVTELEVRGGDAVIEPLEDVRSYRVQEQGYTYYVREQRYAMFPQQSGPLEIAPVTLDARVVMGNASMLNPFGQRIAPIRLESEPVKLSVQPAPSGLAGDWLPATNLILQETWSSDRPLQLGEPITRRVAIIADGLTAGQLPDLGQRLAGGLPSYPETPDLRDQTGEYGVTGIREDQIALIPDAAGDFKLPAVRVRWWNTDSNSMQVATLPERTIKVLGGVAGTAAQPPQTTESAPAEGPTSIAGGDVAIGDTLIPESSRGATPWRTLTGVFALLWLASLVIVFLQARRKAVGSVAEYGQADAARGGSISPARVCYASDLSDLRRGLMRWAASRWPEQPPRSLLELRDRLPDGGPVQALHRALYAGGDPADVDREALRLALQSARDRAEDRPSTLPPLYPA